MCECLLTSKIKVESKNVAYLHQKARNTVMSLRPVWRSEITGYEYRQSLKSTRLCVANPWRFPAERYQPHNQNFITMDNSIGSLGRTKGRRPKANWRRAMERELKQLNYSWSSIEKLGKTGRWLRNFVAAPCATRHIGQ